MDQSSQEELNRIIDIGSDGLTPEEKDFLYARRSYLNKQQRQDFKDVIKAKDEEIAVVSSETAK